MNIVHTQIVNEVEIVIQRGQLDLRPVTRPRAAGMIGEIRSSDKSIVPRADDDGVVIMIRHE